MYNMILPVLLLLFSFVPVQYQTNEQSVGANGCYTFTVDNQSSYAVGNVTVTDLGSNSAYIDVTSTGQFTQTICFTASGVVINGYLVEYPNTASVTLAVGDVIDVSWESPSIVKFINHIQQGRPNG